MGERTAIVTGASSGIGRATARALAAAGVRVAGGARRVERLETEVALAPDVLDADSCARFVAEASSGSARSVRFKGDTDQAADVYKGIDPLTPEDVADCILFALTRPWYMNVDEIVVKARHRSSGARIHREP